MGERLSMHLFKGGSRDDFLGAMEKVARKRGGEFVLGEKCQPPHWCRFASREDVHTLSMDSREWPFTRDLSWALGGAPWITLRIQEGSHWDSTLGMGAGVLDNFSTLPEYFNEHPAVIESLKGRPRVLSLAWGVPVERLERYLCHWGMREVDDDTYDTILKGKAYEGDRYEYGDIWQVLDFMAALGGVDPNEHGEEARLTLQRLD